MGKIKKVFKYDKILCIKIGVKDVWLRGIEADGIVSRVTTER
jgi:hypothetical protein